MFVFGACGRRGNKGGEMNRAELQAKLNVVLEQMVGRCENPQDKADLKSAEPFYKIQGLAADIIGFSVPINPGTNRAHITFTLEHFLRTAPEVLAAEALEDLKTARETKRKGSRG